MENLVNLQSFWSGKNVFVTGHTGFKGSWLCIWLKMLGANVTGYSLSPDSSSGIYELAQVSKVIDNEVIADIRDEKKVLETLRSSRAEIVFHLAAQPLVQKSYLDPILTYDVNVTGLAKVLWACNSSPQLKVIVNVTSDKCYENNEWCWPYREIDNLGGHDPYSSSKACAEIVSSAFARSFFDAGEKSLATARAGNVIGGGDQAENRLIPDFFRAVASDEALKVRNPAAVRPWQHVLEPLSGYLQLAEKLYRDGKEYTGSWNFGPNPNSTKSVGQIIELLTKLTGFKKIDFLDELENHEARMLSLDSSKAEQLLRWTPKWEISHALEKSVYWFECSQRDGDLLKLSMDQIEEYVS